jgi:PAS domain S-box-containing protein
VKRHRRRRIEPSVAAALIAAGALVLTVGLAVLREQRRTVEAGDWSRHTLHVLRQMSTVLQRVTEAETGQRGYMLTGDPAYLTPYKHAVAALPHALARLRKLTAEQPVQQRRLDILEPLVAAKLEELRLTMWQRDAGDEAGLQDTVRAGLGKDYMDRIRAKLTAAAKAERQLLRQRIKDRQTHARNATWLMLGGSVTALLVMSLAAAVLTALLRRAREAEVERRQSEERLRVTLRSIGDAVIATDAQGLIVFMNPVAEALTAWREGDAQGHPLEEVFRIIDAETRETVESPAARVTREGTTVVLANHTLLLARDGREIQIDDSGAPIQTAGGELMGVVLVFRDVSEREAAEAEHRGALWAEAARVEAERTADILAAARADAERANEAKDAFLAILSHELRSPLSAMLAWVGLLQRRSDDAATRRRAVTVLERSVRTQTQLINDLLDVSRIVSGKLQLDRAPLDLVAELPESLDGLQPVAEGKGVTLIRDLCSGPLVVVGDEARLDQVMRNLVENAIKFTPSGGRVTIRLARTGREAELTVTDTGDGFPAELRSAIFARFHQSATPRTRRHGGLGLGLAIVRHLVEEHGGTVMADSPGPGRGATFVVRLPLADGVLPVRTQVPRSDDAPVDLHGVSVLLVEDDAEWREAVALGLAQAGADVTSAGSVAEALALLDTHSPRVLVSDIGMPGADGYELVQRARARLGVPLHAVAMTGFADAGSRERCLRLGFDEFLAKPFEPGRLVAILGALLAAQRSA